MQPKQRWLPRHLSFLLTIQSGLILVIRGIGKSTAGTVAFFQVCQFALFSVHAVKIGLEKKIIMRYFAETLPGIEILRARNSLTFAEHLRLWRRFLSRKNGAWLSLTRWRHKITDAVAYGRIRLCLCVYYQKITLTKTRFEPCHQIGRESDEFAIAINQVMQNRKAIQPGLPPTFRIHGPYCRQYLVVTKPTSFAPSPTDGKTIPRMEANIT